MGPLSPLGMKEERTRNEYEKQLDRNIKHEDEEQEERRTGLVDR
jgi:adenylyl- and sulfurtransferase ThiI